jgi:integrase
MAVVRITKRACENLKPGETKWDTEVRGFGVRRQCRDANFILKYRFRGRPRLYTIGLFGSPWTPDAARDEARRLLGLVHSKENPRDPAAERDRTKDEPTLSDVIRKYLDDYAPSHKKSRTVAEDKRNLERHVVPVLGKIRITQVSLADVARFHAGRSAFPVNANRCLTTLSHVFSMAEKWGYRPRGSNPCKGVDRYKETPRERLLTAEELARLGDALAEAENGPQPARQKERKARQSAEDYRAIACIRLLAFTGARLSEILTLQWAWIDFERGLARLPDSKTGAKTLILTAPALAIINALPRVKGNPYILPGDRKGTHFVGVQKPWQRIRKLAGLDDVRLHDLRHAFASIAVASGDSLYLVGKVLGHRQASTTERYAHLAPDPVRAVADRTAQRIAGMMRGGSASVVPLERSGK